MQKGEFDAEVLPVEAFADMASCLKVLAHPARLCMVNILMQGEFPVHAIAAMCGIKQNQACEHLRLMQSCGLLTSERHAQRVHYKIAKPQLSALFDCIREQCKAGGH
jgi:DNA-binding transcriptional ArsR family regulator